MPDPVAAPRPFEEASRRRLAVARGDAPADLLLTGARVTDVFEASFFEADVAIVDGVIAGVGRYTDAEQTVDLEGAVLAPGLIDAHMHVESTMLRPSAFAPLALAHGTTGAVFDPHEIANVLGIEGMRWIMADAAAAPGRWMFALSSCVPASPHETSGARLEAEDLAPMFDDEAVVALAEMMNFPGLVAGDPGLLAKLRLGLERRGVVDGHAPGVSGRMLQAYAGVGVSSDHECTTADEAREKLRAGQMIFIREGSAARNLEALAPTVTESNWTRFGFCTDDRHPQDLAEHGHIDHVLRRAVQMGMPPARAIAMATQTTAQHYGLTKPSTHRPALGAVAPGYAADLVVFDAPETLNVQSVWGGGEDVEALAGSSRAADAERPTPPQFAASVHLPVGFGKASLAVPACAKIRVIGLRPGQLLTDHLILQPQLEDGYCVADVSRDLMKLAVIERHGRSAAGDPGLGVGFVQGFGLRAGALGSTVGHDSHNVTVVGASDSDMVLAARTLEGLGGGVCAVLDGEVLAVLSLPIAGLMADVPAQDVVEGYRAVLAAADRLSAGPGDPFMPLSFCPLTVIPHLKLGDRGLVDVDRFARVSLAAEPS